MSNTSQSEAPQRKGQIGHCKSLAVPDLNTPVRLRIGHLLTLYGVSHTTYYRHLDKQLIPQPDGFVAGRPFWKTSTIRADLDR